MKQHKLTNNRAYSASRGTSLCGSWASCYYSVQCNSSFRDQDSCPWRHRYALKIRALDVFTQQTKYARNWNFC